MHAIHILVVTVAAKVTLLSCSSPLGGRRPKKGDNSKGPKIVDILAGLFGQNIFLESRHYKNF